MGFDASSESRLSNVIKWPLKKACRHHKIVTCRSRSSLALCCVWNALGSSRSRSPPEGRTTADHTLVRMPEALWICLAVEENGRTLVSQFNGKKHAESQKVFSYSDSNQHSSCSDFEFYSKTEYMYWGYEWCDKDYLSVFLEMHEKHFFCSNEDEWLAAKDRSSSHNSLWISGWTNDGHFNRINTIMHAFWLQPQKKIHLELLN